MKQELTSFEFAESLPLSLGIVIDGSGSMKDAMPIVHQAASEFVQKLVSKEKDQGFVIEFRERPTLLASLSHKASDLERAIAETHANGATALYDAVVMALYQFRATPGRKAVVVLTDGDDNHSWTRLRDAPALRALGGRPDLLHRPEPLVPRHGHQGADERARGGHGRRGVLRREGVGPAGGLPEDRDGAALAVLPAGTSRTRRRARTSSARSRSR